MTICNPADGRVSRRALLAGAGVALLAASGRAPAQGSGRALPLVGILTGGSPSHRVFLDALSGLGCTE